MSATIPGDAGLAQTILWMTRLAGGAAAINALELWAIRTDWSDGGIWRPATLRPTWGALTPLLGSRGFRAVRLAQLSAAMMMIASPVAALGQPVASAATAMVLLGTLLAAMRFRGTVNGGSDGMLFTVLIGLLLSRLAPPDSRWAQAGVLYIAAQLTLSYLRAGLVKVTRRPWWTGEALLAFLRLPAYGAPSPLVAWAETHPGWVRLAGLAVMSFECVALIAWRSPTWCLMVIAVALVFHGTVALLFRLNRFLWTWGAAMPSLWYAAQLLR
ncbi:MAG: hypothetical protein WCK74_07555 [Gemmatimonadaceae bacterium]